MYAIELTRDLPARGEPRATWPCLSRWGRRSSDVSKQEVVPVLEGPSGLGTSSVREIREIMAEPDHEILLALATDHDLFVVDEDLSLFVVDEDLSVRFEHPLVGSAVSARMTPLARRSRHGRLAARATDPDVRAHHLALSTDAPDAEIAALLEDAAGCAAPRSAHDLASEFAGHSLRLTPPEEKEAARHRALLEISTGSARGREGPRGGRGGARPGDVAALRSEAARCDACLPRRALVARPRRAACGPFTRRLRAAANDGAVAKVCFLGSAGVPGDDSFLSIFSAPSLEAVARLVEHAGLTADRIVPALWRAGDG